jgi:hypothetical protein
VRSESEHSRECKFFTTGFYQCSKTVSRSIHPAKQDQSHHKLQQDNFFLKHEQIYRPIVNNSGILMIAIDLN